MCVCVCVHVCVCVCVCPAVHAASQGVLKAWEDMRAKSARVSSRLSLSNQSSPARPVGTLAAPHAAYAMPALSPAQAAAMSYTSPPRHAQHPPAFHAQSPAAAAAAAASAPDSPKREVRGTARLVKSPITSPGGRPSGSAAGSGDEGHGDTGARTQSAVPRGHGGPSWKQPPKLPVMPATSSRGSTAPRQQSEPLPKMPPISPAPVGWGKVGGHVRVAQCASPSA